MSLSEGDIRGLSTLQDRRKNNKHPTSTKKVKETPTLQFNFCPMINLIHLSPYNWVGRGFRNWFCFCRDSDSDLKILRIPFQSCRYEEMHAGVYALCRRLNDLGIAATDTWPVCRMNSSLKT